MLPSQAKNPITLNPYEVTGYFAEKKKLTEAEYLVRSAGGSCTFLRVTRLYGPGAGQGARPIAKS